jgi:hypothetical protein
MEDLKHNIEQSVASTGLQILQNVAKNTAKSMNACLKEGGDIFSIRCDHTLFITFLLSLKK